MSTRGAEPKPPNLRTREPDSPGPLRGILSTDAVSSVERLAELLLTSPRAKRSLIQRAELEGVTEETSPLELVGALRRWAEPGHIIKKIIDAPSDATVIAVLSQIIWVGARRMYVFVRPEHSSAGHRRVQERELVVFLEKLVVAQIEGSPCDIDRMARESDFLELVGEGPESKEDDADPFEPSPQQVLELVTTSQPGDRFFVAGDEVLALPKAAAEHALAHWGQWAMAAREPAFSLEAAVASSAGLSDADAQQLASHIRRSNALKGFVVTYPPTLEGVATYVVRLSAEEAEEALERIRSVFFAARFLRLEDLLLACIEVAMRGNGPQ